MKFFSRFSKKNNKQIFPKAEEVVHPLNVENNKIDEPSIAGSEPILEIREAEAMSEIPSIIKDSKYEKKILRRQIFNDFKILSNKGEKCSTEDVVEFIAKYYSVLSLLKESIEPYKHYDDLPSTLTWKYLNEYSGQDLDRLVVEQQIKAERVLWLEKKIPNPIVLYIECSDQGPELVSDIQPMIRKSIEQVFDSSKTEFEITGVPMIRNLGEYQITLVFSQGEKLARQIKLLPMLDNFTLEDYPDLIGVLPMPFDRNVHIFDALNPILVQSQQSDFSEYFVLLSSILKTIYETGYWKTTWAQDLFTEWKGQRELYKNGGIGSSSAEIVLNKILEPPQVYGNKPTIISENFRRVRSALISVKGSIAQAKTSIDSPKSYTSVIQNLRALQGKKSIELSEYLLSWCKDNTIWGKEITLRVCAILYCYYSAKHQYNIKPAESRPYLYSFFHLFNQLPNEIQKDFSSYYYESLYIYFNCYNIYIKPEVVASSQEVFYTSLYGGILKSKQLVELGNALTTLAIVSPTWVYDLMNRVKTGPVHKQKLSIIINALSDSRVFRVEPLQCLILLSKINPKIISTTIGRQSLSNIRPEERRLIVVSLIRFLSSNSSLLDSVFSEFSSNSTPDTSITLAFSCLVEPYFLNDPKKESTLKAAVVAKVLGLPDDNRTMAYFIAQSSELTNLFDKFSRSTDANIKGGYGYNILNKIHSFRRYMVDNTRGSFKEIVLRFFRSVEAHLTIEQSKLIFDPTIEIVLLHDRTFYSSSNTRLVFEVRNIGEGIADSVELDLIPVDGKYNVEEAFRSQKIENLSNKTIIQKEVFLQPLVSANQSIDIDIILKYHTLKGETKIAELPVDNRTVWLYEESEFKRVESPYSISAPATTWFFGRQDLLRGMIDNLKGGSNTAGHSTSMIIYGLRRAGKTSVVKRFIENTLVTYNLDKIYIPIYIDLLRAAEKTENTREFLILILEAIYIAVEKIIIPKMPFDRNEIRINVEQSPYNAFSDLVSRLLDNIPNNRILMVLDEFSILQSKLGESNNQNKIEPYVFSFLSNTIQNATQLTFFFTGTYSLMEMMRDQAFDLAKICTPRLISFLDDDSAQRLVTEPVEYKKDNNRGYLEYHPRAVNRIVTVTNKHPYLIQYLCMLLIERMNETVKQSRVNLSDVNKVITDVISKPAYEMPMLTLWNEFGLSQHKVLSAIASLAMPNSELQEQASFQQISIVQDGISIQEIVEYLEGNRIKMSFEEAISVCKSLTDAEMLERAAVSGDVETYRIAIPLYEAWLKRNKSIQSFHKE